MITADILAVWAGKCETTARCYLDVCRRAPDIMDNSIMILSSRLMQARKSQRVYIFVYDDDAWPAAAADSQMDDTE